VKQRIEGKPNRDKLARQWAKVWNNTYKRTGDEGKAYKMANAILSDRLLEELFEKLKNAEHSF